MNGCKYFVNVVKLGLVDKVLCRLTAFVEFQIVEMGRGCHDLMSESILVDVGNFESRSERCGSAWLAGGGAAGGNPESGDYGAASSVLAGTWGG